MSNASKKAKRMLTIHNTSAQTHEYQRGYADALCEAVTPNGWRCSNRHAAMLTFCARHQRQSDRLATVTAPPQPAPAPNSVAAVVAQEAEDAETLHGG